MSKRIISLLLAIALVAVTLTGCGSKETGSSAKPNDESKASSAAAPAESKADASDAEEGKTSGTGEIKVGVNLFGSAAYSLITLSNNSKLAFEAFGDDVTVMDDNFQPDKIVQDIENMVVSGVDGVAVWLPADSFYRNVAKICEDNKVPFVLVDKIPTDPELAEEIKSNPYFAGAVSPANSVYGEQMADFAIEKGWTSCIVSSSAVGDPSDTPRLDAFTAKFTAAGGEIKAELHSDSPDKIQPDIEDALMANPNVEFIYGVGSDFGCGGVRALENLHKDGIKVITSGLDSQAVNDLAEEKLELLTGDNWAAGILSAIILQNWMEGNPLKDADGNVPYIEDLMPFSLTPDQSALFTKVFIDNFCYTQDELKAMSTKNNPDFDYDAFMEVAKSFSFEERARALADAGVVSADELAAAGIE